MDVIFFRFVHWVELFAVKHKAYCNWDNINNKPKRQFCDSTLLPDVQEILFFAFTEARFVDDDG